MKVDGACHCGSITFEADVDPDRVRICHCIDCQILSSTAFRVTAPTEEANFRLISGKPKTYIKTAESGAKRAQVFCPDCGTGFYATSVGDGPKVFGLRVGCLKQRGELKPQRQYWTRSAVDWLDEIGSLPGDEKQ